MNESSSPFDAPAGPARGRSVRRRALLILVAIFLVPLVGMQLIPVSRANPPVTLEIDAPAEVLGVLRESCYDCHSNETRWPWYAYVAPMSWFVAHHVEEGREHLNFTEWDRYGAGDRRHLIEGVMHEINEGEMPLRSYLILHSDAHLSDADKSTLAVWTGVPAGEESDHD